MKKLNIYCDMHIPNVQESPFLFITSVVPNEQLKEELAALRDQGYDATLYKSENEWLREYLELKRIKHSFEFADAKVVGRETTNTRTVYTLDRGTSAGVEKNMPIITSDGVVGYIIETGLTWSKADPPSSFPKSRLSPPSSRKPSTPLSTQKRMESYSAFRSWGFSQLRSGCSGAN